MFIRQSEIILHHWQNYLITFLSDVSESSGRALRPADFSGLSQVSWFTTFQEIPVHLDEVIYGLKSSHRTGLVFEDSINVI